MTPAVRSVQGGCIEEMNCDWETATLCAFNQTDTSGRVAFLACMDEKEGTAKSASKLCAPSAKIDEEALLTCYNGQQGQELLKEASDAWNKAFPQRASVPHTFVNQKDVDADYKDLKAALCSAGANADVCKTRSRCDI